MNNAKNTAVNALTNCCHALSLEIYKLEAGLTDADNPTPSGNGHDDSNSPFSTTSQLEMMRKQHSELTAAVKWAESCPPAVNEF